MHKQSYIINHKQAYIINHKQASRSTSKHRQASSSIVSHRQSSSVIVSHRQSSSVIVSHRQSSSAIVSHRQSSSVIVSQRQSTSVIVSHRQSSSDVVSHRQTSSVIVSHRQSPSIGVDRRRRCCPPTPNHASCSRKQDAVCHALTRTLRQRHKRTRRHCLLGPPPTCFTFHVVVVIHRTGLRYCMTSGGRFRPHGRRQRCPHGSRWQWLETYATTLPPLERTTTRVKQPLRTYSLSNELYKKFECHNKQQNETDSVDNLAWCEPSVERNTSKNVKHEMMAPPRLWQLTCPRCRPLSRRQNVSHGPLTNDGVNRTASHTSSGPLEDNVVGQSVVSLATTFSNHHSTNKKWRKCMPTSEPSYVAFPASSLIANHNSVNQRESCSGLREEGDPRRR